MNKYKAIVTDVKRFSYEGDEQEFYQVSMQCVVDINDRDFLASLFDRLVVVPIPELPDIPKPSFIPKVKDSESSQVSTDKLTTPKNEVDPGEDSVKVEFDINSVLAEANTKKTK